MNQYIKEILYDKFEVNKDNNNSVITIEVKNNKSIKLNCFIGQR